MKNKSCLLRSLLIILFLTFTACSTLRDDNIELVKNYFEALNTKNEALCDRIVTADFKKSSNGKTEEETGPAVLIKAIKIHSTNNSEYKYTIEDIFASKERVGVRWRWNSINIKTGEPKPINIAAMSVFEIKGDKIFRLWQAFDLEDFNRQLGN
ncbi:nuclear transport factor 2 family protein [Bacteroidota bacterium]